MTMGNGLSADYPNGARFQQMAIDNVRTEHELKQLKSWYLVEQLRYQTKLAERERYQKELDEYTQRDGLSDHEEGKRQKKIRQLTRKIAACALAEPMTIEVYQIQKSMLEHKLRETAFLNSSLLIWQAQQQQN